MMTALHTFTADNTGPTDDPQYVPACGCGWAHPLTFARKHFAYLIWQEHAASAPTTPLAPMHEHTPPRARIDLLSHLRDHHQGYNDSPRRNFGELKQHHAFLHGVTHITYPRSRQSPSRGVH